MEPTTILLIVFAALSILSITLHIVRPAATLTKVIDEVTPIIEKTVTEIVTGVGGSAELAGGISHSMPMHDHRPSMRHLFSDDGDLGLSGLGGWSRRPKAGTEPYPYASALPGYVSYGSVDNQAILPFRSQDDQGQPVRCPKGKQVPIVARPQGAAFRMNNLVFDGDENFVVHDIQVGPQSQFAQRRLPISAAALKAIMPLKFNTAQTGMDITVIVEYVGNALTSSGDETPSAVCSMVATGDFA